MRIVLNIIKGIFIMFFAVLIFFEGLMFVQNKILKNEYPNLFGYSILTVKTGSMEPIIPAGSSILSKVENDYKIGDIVVYKEKNILVTHEVISIDGYKYETKGTANNTSEIISKDKIQAKIVCYDPWFSNLATNMRNPVILIILGFLGLIVPEILLNIFKKTEKVKIIKQ